MKNISKEEFQTLFDKSINENVKLNLHIYNFIDFDFSGLDLPGLDFSYLNLKGANFVKSDLQNTKFNETNLIGANFDSAMLVGASFENSNLSNAILINAILWDAKIYKCNINNTNFKFSKFGRTQLGALNFAKSIGLENVFHSGTSTFGTDSLYISKGEIPRIFLEGIGFSEELISLSQNIAKRKEDYYSVFISYSHKDIDFAQKLQNDLQKNGVRTWFAPFNLRPGEPFIHKIQNAIKNHDRHLFILSKNSLESEWMAREFSIALNIEEEQGKSILIPIRIDDSLFISKTNWVKNITEKRHILDFSNWEYEDAYKIMFQRILKELKGSPSVQNFQRKLSSIFIKSLNEYFELSIEKEGISEE